MSDRYKAFEEQDTGRGILSGALEFLLVLSITCMLGFGVYVILAADLEESQVSAPEVLQTV